jgi:Cyclophilin type peptidyl-prolyl cis-trans isomerase/CLD
MKSFLCVVGLLAVAGAVEAPAFAQSKNPVAVIVTSLGDISIELDPGKAPLSVENFLAYVKSGHYEGTIFHRVIKGFMIQGGGMTENMREKPTRPPIKNEAANGLKNERGTVAMARRSTARRHSSSSTPERRTPSWITKYATSGTPCSARSSPGWMSSTRSNRSRRPPAMCRSSR